MSQTATSTEFQINDRVQMDSHPSDVVAGAPIYFETEEN